MTLKRRFQFILYLFVALLSAATLALILGIYHEGKNLMSDRIRSELDLVVNSQLSYLIEEFQRNDFQSAKLRSLALASSFADIFLHIEVTDSGGKTIVTTERNYDGILIGAPITIEREIGIYPEFFGKIRVTGAIPNEYVYKTFSNLTAHILAYLCIIVVAIVILPLLLTRFILNPIIQISDYISLASQNSLQSPPKTLSGELNRIGDLHYTAMLNTQNSIKAKSLAESKAQIARQVAHDIRSPIGALDIVLERLSSEDPESHALARAAIRRIQGIADDLLKNSNSKQATELERVDIGSVLDEIISEKLVSVPSKVTLQNHVPKGVWILSKTEVLKRIISNVLNNSIEAITQDGQIVVQHLESADFITISVSDNGIGIPDHIISRLGKEEVSFGKDGNGTSGSGMGLFHANQNLKSWGGSLEIACAPGGGTLVSLTLRKA